MFNFFSNRLLVGCWMKKRVSMSKATNYIQDGFGLLMSIALRQWWGHYLILLCHSLTSYTIRRRTNLRRTGMALSWCRITRWRSLSRSKILRHAGSNGRYTYTSKECFSQKAKKILKYGFQFFARDNISIFYYKCPIFITIFECINLSRWCTQTITIM
jgi:hypothetical protein